MFPESGELPFPTKAAHMPANLPLWGKIPTFGKTAVNTVVLEVGRATARLVTTYRKKLDFGSARKRLDDGRLEFGSARNSTARWLVEPTSSQKICKISSKC